MGDSEKNVTSRYCLYLGPEGPAPSNVFFEVDNELLACDLCRLFTDVYGAASEHIFTYKALPGDGSLEYVRLRDALNELRLYDDPDPGVYDPPPSRQTLLRAEYSRRAGIWADLIDQRQTAARGYNPAATSVPAASDEMGRDANVQAVEKVRRLLEKHRLMFLFFATPKRINPLNHASCWETIREDRYPRIPVDDIDSEGEFLFVHRWKLETFAQAAVAQFGTGVGSKPRIMDECGNIVDVEGGSHPIWELDEAGCVHLNESANEILEACRNAMRNGTDRLLSRFLQRIQSSLYDEAQTKWYACNHVRWSFLMRLDDTLHAIKLAEFERCLETKDRQPAMDNAQGDAFCQKDEKTADASEIPQPADISSMPEEDRRTSGLILLLMLAQAYYKMLESAVSMATWFTVLDMDLNHCYLWTTQTLTNLLKNHEHLRDFPGTFEPALPDLYPSTIGDLDWQDMIAPDVEDFLATVQKYVLAKGVCQPEEGSPAWIMVEFIRPSIERAIRCADNYHTRLRQAQGRLQRESVPAKSPQTNETQLSDRITFPTPKGAVWADVTIKFLDGETVTVRVSDQSGRYVYAEMGLIDGRTKRPTKQWELLRSFAQNHGIFTWQNAGADRRNQKRREVLADNLKAFFGIEGEPIELTDDKKGWRTTFTIIPDS
jgi:hypothetical protein